jgi:hypothetical protein
MKENTLRVFQNRVLGRAFGLKEEEIARDCKHMHSKVFQNRVLGRAFGLKEEEIARDCKHMHSKVLHKLYSSLCIIRVSKSG